MQALRAPAAAYSVRCSSERCVALCCYAARHALYGDVTAAIAPRAPARQRGIDSAGGAREREADVAL